MIDVDDLINEQKQNWDANHHVNIEVLVQNRLGDGWQARIAPQSWLELICHEVVLREERGERPSLSEYQARFPALSEELSIQWDIDRLFTEMDTTASEFSTIPKQEIASGRRAPYLESSFGQRYEIVAEMGRGTNGIVYEAWDSQLKRRLAIKRLRSGTDASNQEIVRIRSEAEAIARIHSPYIVQVFDVGDTNGLPFLVMEFCEGGSLAKRLDGKPLRPRVVAEMIACIAKGVAAAHDCRIIHRDLKPGNILLESFSNWVPKVADFGLAKLLDSDLHATATGTTLGTPAYMAPEQAFGNARHVGVACDIYSIGAILYECLTGSPPFRGATPAETLHQVRNQEPVSIRHLQSSVPIDLETIALKCLHKDPTKRYSSAIAVADDLHRYLDGKPILARRVGSLERLNRWRKRNPAVALLLVITVSLLSMIAIGSTTAAVWLKNERDNVLRTDAERRQELYRAYILEAKTIRLSKHAGQREFGLEAIRGILRAIPWQKLTDTQRGELRDEAIASLMRADSRRSANADPAGQLMVGGDVDVDPQLRWVSHVGYEERTAIESLEPGIAPLYVEGPATPRPTGSLRSISPDGHWLVEVRWWLQGSGSEEVKLRVWDFTAGKWVAERSSDTWYGGSVFDANRSNFYTWGSDDCIHRLELPSGDEIGKSPARMPDVRSMALSPDGQRLAIAAGSGLTEIVDTKSWRTLATFPQFRKVCAVEWVKETGTLYFGCESGELVQIDPLSYSAFPLTQERKSPVFGLRSSRDGKYLAIAHGDSTFEVRDMVRGQLLFHSSGTFLQFASVGARYAYLLNNKVQTAEIADECIYTAVQANADGITFTNDGEWILTGGMHGMKIFSSVDLQLSGDFQTDHCGPIAIAPSGNEVYSFGLFSKVWRWPLSAAPDSGELRFGPASRVRSAGELNLVGSAAQYQGRHLTCNLDGSLMAIADYRAGRVLVMKPGEKAILREFEHLNTSRIAFSPDAKWIASAAWIFPNVMVWSLETKEAMLHVEHGNMVAFSPDGKYLAVSRSDGIFLYDTSQWQMVRNFPRKELTMAGDIGRPVAFQPQGRLMAFPVAVEQIQLVDYETGEIVANLTGVGSGEITNLTFSPDGSRIAFSSAEQKLGIIDLATLKSGLMELKLSVANLPDRTDMLRKTKSKVSIENGPAFPTPEKWSQFSIQRAMGEFAQGHVSDAIDAITYGIERLRPTASDEAAALHTERGKYQEINGSFAAAEADWLAALKFQPLRSDASLYLARLGVLGPPELHKPMQTLQLAATIALDQTQLQEASLLSGLAHYHLGRWEVCNRHLREVTELKHAAFAKLFLCVSLSKCGHYDEAKEALEAFQRMAYTAELDMTGLERQDLDRAKSSLKANVEQLKDHFALPKSPGQ